LEYLTAQFIIVLEVDEISDWGTTMELCIYAERFYPDPGGKIPVAFDNVEKSQEIPGLYDRLRIVIITRGTGIIQIADRKFSVIAPAVLCINENEQARLLDSSDWEAQIVYFHPEYINGNLTFDKIRGTEIESLITSKQDIFLFQPFIKRSETFIGLLCPDTVTMNNILNLLNSAKKEIMEQAHSYWSCRARSYFLELLFTLVNIYQSPEICASRFFEKSSPLADEVILYLNTNYEKKITIPELCFLFHTNKNTLQKQFREATGQSVVAYIIDLRVKLAMLMLRDTGISVMEISDRLGFSDSAHFNKMFKKASGCSPLEYRRQFTWLGK